MATPDLNLLVTLEVLLAEGSVARAARRLRLSPSAMSRALARLRRTVGDPLLVRAGRRLVPSPLAVQLKARLPQLVQDAQAVLRAQQPPDLSRLTRTFTLLASDGFVESFGPALIARVAREAPAVILHFRQKPDRDRGEHESANLRDGSVDFETGVLGEWTSPEVRTQALFRDRMVAVLREGHPLSQGRLTLQRYASGRHVLVSRRGRDRGQIDEALKALGLGRQIVTIVGGFSAALALARASDLIASVPDRYSASLLTGLEAHPLPVRLPAFSVALLWHPRNEGDPAHRWLRHCVREVCGSAAARAG